MKGILAGGCLGKVVCPSKLIFKADPTEYIERVKYVFGQKLWRRFTMLGQRLMKLAVVPLLASSVFMITQASQGLAATPDSQTASQTPTTETSTNSAAQLQEFTKQLNASVDESKPLKEAIPDQNLVKMVVDDFNAMQQRPLEETDKRISADTPLSDVIAYYKNYGQVIEINQPVKNWTGYKTLLENDVIGDQIYNQGDTY